MDFKLDLISQFAQNRLYQGWKCLDCKKNRWCCS